MEQLSRDKNGRFIKTHGLSSKTLRQTHANMMHRCYDNKSKSYSAYGAKGVNVCNVCVFNME